MLGNSEQSHHVVKKTISIVVPCYNEESSLIFFYESLCQIIDTIFDVDFDILCIDDGSSDQTLKKLIDLSKQDSRFHVIELSRNFGKEAALTAGIDEATGDAVIVIDADLQDPPHLILSMINEWLKGAEVVLAKRADRSSDSLLKRKTAEIFYRFHNKLSSIKIPENVGDFRLMDRVVVDAIKKLPEQHRFMKGLFAWVGFKTVTVEYSREPRIVGNTKFSGWKLWNLALEGITSFSSIPLKLWSYLGFLITIFSIVYALFVVSRALINGIDVPGYASLIVLILFFNSLILISIGILGEYVSRIYDEVKNRPIYLIKKRHGGKK